MYVDTLKPFDKSYEGKIKISTCKLTGTIKLFSGLANQLSRCIGVKDGSLCDLP